MKVRSFIPRIVAGAVLMVAGAAWCVEARSVKAPAETAAVGSFAFLGGFLAVRSGVRKRRRRREMLETAELLHRGGYYPTRRVP